MSSEPRNAAAASLASLFPGRSEMAMRMRALDWSATELGPTETWPENLRVAVRLCLTSRVPILLWWGPKMVLLYNDASLPWLTQAKHPRALGRPGYESWSEIWDAIGPMLDSVYATGEATWSADFELFIDRKVRKEEVYIVFTYAPIFAADGRTVDGIFCPCFETTEKVIGARRLETLRKLGMRPAEARTLEEACRAAAAVLAENPRDIPFAAIYTVDSGANATLAAVSGAAGAHLFPEHASASDAEEQSPWQLPAVLRDRRAVDCIDLPARGIHVPSGPWPETVANAVILPIRAAQHHLSGIVILGASARRPLDDDYRTFFDLISGNLATAISEAQAYAAVHLPTERIGTRGAASTAAAIAAFIEEARDWAADADLPPQPGASAGRPRVLVVDDNADLRLYVRHLLEDRYDVMTAADGAAALEAAHSARPDLILADVMMPNADGLALLRAVKSDPALEGIPVILLSARAGEEACIEGIRAGAVDYLVKPFGARELVARVEVRLESSRRNRTALELERQLRQVGEMIAYKRGAEALRAREERFRRYFELGLVGMAMTSPTKGILDVNDELCRILGYSRDELLRLTWSEITHPDDVPADVAHFDRVLAGEIDGYSLDKRWIRKDGRVIDTIMAARSLRRADGSVDSFVGLVQDITDRKRAEKQRNEMLRHLIRAQEEERRRIAREVHDDLGQQLSALRLNVTTWANDPSSRPVGEHLDDLKTIVANLDRELDFVVWAIRPPALDDFGLVDALTDYAKNWSKHAGVQAEVVAIGLDGNRLSNEIETVLYRVTQEGLTNIARHARAEHVSILLRRDAEQVSLILEDDGVGFDVEHALRAGEKRFGLIGMRQRVAYAGGTFEIESGPRRGVTIVVRIPTDDPERRDSRS